MLEMTRPWKGCEAKALASGCLVLCESHTDLGTGIKHHESPTCGLGWLKREGELYSSCSLVEDNMAKVAFIDGLFIDRDGGWLKPTARCVLGAWKVFLLNSWPDRASHSVGLTALRHPCLHLFGLQAETCWAATEARRRLGRPWII